MNPVPAHADSLSATAAKPEAAVAVNEVHNSDSEESLERTTEALTMTNTKRSVSRTSSFQAHHVYETIQGLIRRMVGDLDDVHDHHLTGIDLDTYLEFIADERLMHMPRKGSQWDRILKVAVDFGVRIEKFSEVVAHFVPKSRDIAYTALGSLRLLLELGIHQSGALEPTFDVLYDFSLLLGQAVKRQELLKANQTTKEATAELFSDLVELIGDIAVYYRRRINSMSARQSATIDFDGNFGKSIARIWLKKEELSNHMWKFKLRHKRYSMSIEALRRQLKPEDTSVRSVLYGRIADKAGMAEGTCEWIQPHLLDFFRSEHKTFTITGTPGSGKSVLAGWIRERLESTLGRVRYETIGYTFHHDTASQRTAVAFLKGILHQLLERNVGDAALFAKLVAVFEDYKKHNNLKKFEHGLWEAVTLSLKTINDEEKDTNMVIIVDSLDELTGEGHAAELNNHVRECVNKLSRAHAIILTNQTHKLGHEGFKHTVEAHDNHGDIVKFLKASLAKSQHFKSQNRGAQESFVRDLTAKTKESFLLAFLATKVLALENSYDSFYRAGQEMPTGLDDMLKKVVGHIDLHDNTTKHIISFMMVAERPFTVAEMETLLSVDAHKRTIRSHPDVRKHIASHCHSLIVERQGLLRFKHAEIHKYFMHKVAGHHKFMSLKDAHSELTKRVLYYAKYMLTAIYEPSFEVLGGSTLDEIFHSHSLAEYAVRHWAVHFRRSSFCGHKDELHLSDDFKHIFPDTAFFAMIERACWSRQFTDEEARGLHELTLHVRTACFGEKHVAVMQSLIIMGCYYRYSDVTRAGEYFYRASIVGQGVLHKYSTVVVTCTNLFLTLTEKLTFTTRTTVFTYREEMIRYTIEFCKTKYGKSSDHVIKWYEILLQLYVSIKEEHNATIIRKELHEIILIRYGKGHHKAKELEGELGGMTVTVKGEEHKDVLKYHGWIFETSDVLESFDFDRIDVILKLIAGYEAESKWALAERLYILLWQRVSKSCRVKATIDLHLIKINIALKYVHFLQRVKRTEEACSILVALWAEYEHATFKDVSIIIRIKEIGVVCRTFGLLTVAVSIFAKVWGWFKACGKGDHEEATSTTILITEVVEEIEETTITKKTTTTTTTTVTETVTREIFETTYTRCKHSGVDAHFFKACMVLINLYLKQEKWSECEIIIKRSLELSWKAVLTTDTKLTITGHFVKECILVATQLAVVYHRQRHFEKAEQIYLRIYRACLATFKIDDAHVTAASLVLIRFYEEYHRHDKVIEIYVELLHGYRKHCGATHTLTIKTLYALGSICMMLGRKDAYEYYIEIVRVLNKGGHCHHDAFEAAVIVCGFYYEEHRWKELREVCAELWETFIHHSHEFVFTESMIITLYERYSYVLEFHAKVEFSVLYKLSVQFKEKVIAHFGASSAIALTALIALATICEKSEEHWHESVTIYEEVITKTRTTTTTTTTVEETTIRTVKKRLSKMYVTIITKGKSKSTTTVERGIAIALELYESLKIEFGCWHEKTLFQLRDLCIIYHRQGSKESHGHIVRLLQLAVVEIITTVTTSFELYTAATTVAGIYLSCGIADVGHQLLHQLRHLIVLHDMEASKDVTIHLGGKVTKLAFVFLIAFEQRLTEKVVWSYSEVAADILLETYLYEEYTRIVKTETKIEIILEVGAKLRGFWYARDRLVQCEILDRKLFAMFKSKFGHFTHVHDDFIFIYYAALLGELSQDRVTVDFALLSCVAGNTKVKELLDGGHFHKAHEVAKCAFEFIKSQHWYRDVHHVSYGYKLAEFMAGIDVPAPKDEALKKAMRATSVKIATEVINACRAAKIDFVALRFKDLVGLIRLLGEQENYTELRTLLEALWHSREVQKNWSSDTVLSIGKMLVHARYAQDPEQPDDAIELCDNICYNLRRSRGWYDPSTLAMSRLLSELYTDQGRHREAMGVHEEVLRELHEDGDEATADNKAVANDFFHRLQRAFQRLGGFDKHQSRYQTLFDHLQPRYNLSVQPIHKWEAKGADEFGTYTRPTHWLLDVPEESAVVHRSSSGSVRRTAVRRTWGSFYGWKSGSGTAEDRSTPTPAKSPVLTI